ncbi:hypothetical protein ABPG72_011157 [Tetrahymena utriculariae]
MSRWFYIKTAATKDSTAVCERCPDFCYSEKPTESEGISDCKCFDRYAQPLSAAQPTCKYCATNATNINDNCICNKGFYGKDATYSKSCPQCPTENYYLVTKASTSERSPSAAKCEKCPEFSYLESGADGFCKCFEEKAEKLDDMKENLQQERVKKALLFLIAKPPTNESTGNKDTQDNGNKDTTSESGNKGISGNGNKGTTENESGNKGSSESGNKRTSENGNKGSQENENKENNNSVIKVVLLQNLKSKTRILKALLLIFKFQDLQCQ